MAQTKALPLYGAICIALLSSGPVHAQAIGIFEGETDIGTLVHPGSSEHDAAAGAYRVSSSGENMWAAKDDFHYVWKKVSGDVTLSADISILGTGGNAHRKGVLMIRQSLDTDSAYVDAALHGDGLASMQSRGAKGGLTYEVQSNVASPKRLRITKRGDYFYVWVSADGTNLQFSGGSMNVRMTEPFYVGIGVCGHDKNNIEKVAFSKVELTASAPNPAAKRTLYSTLETTPIPGDRRVAHVTAGRIEAPVWTRDGATLLFTRNGRLEKAPLAGGASQAMNIESVKRIGRHHGISPDGSRVAFTEEPKAGRTEVYVVPVEGGKPHRITKQSPSVFHGWSSDGKTLLIVGERKGKRGIYSIVLDDGKETLVAALSGNDGSPEFSPDGKHIYFNSDRSGTMQVWRMLADGTAPEQVTDDEFSNWYPHISPDGRRMAVLTCEKDAKSPPADREIAIRVIQLAEKRVQSTLPVFGGQGAMESYSWTTDGRRLAFVTYQSVPQD